MSTSRYCSPTSRATEPGTGFGPVLHNSTKSALIPNRQNGCGVRHPRMAGTRRERATADSPSQSTRLSMPPRS